MQEGSLQQVCAAIHHLYSSSRNAEAQQFLQHFQTSNESWTICDQIIGQHTDSLACCFAAQTLRTKIKKQFKDLPAESLIPLRDSLVNHLRRHGQNTQDQQYVATTTQLCLALADLYIQVPTWRNWIMQLLTQCNSLAGDSTIMLLTLLKVFPEEVESLSGIGANRRNEVRMEISKSSAEIVNFLTHIFAANTTNQENLVRIMKCLETNLKNTLFKTNELAKGPLLDAIFQILATPTVSSSLHEATSDAIAAAIMRSEDLSQHADLAKQLQAKVPQLSVAFKKSIEDEDYDRQNNFCRIFVELSEAYCRQIVEHATTDPNVIGNLVCLELLLLVASHHDYTLIEMTFNIWYRISEELFQYEDDLHLEQFRPYVERFIMELYQHCRIAQDETDLVDPKSDYGEFRQKAVEAMRDVVFMIKTDSCVLSMFNILKTASANPNASWDEMEAALFIISSVVHNLFPEEEGVMPELLTSIVQLPPTSHPAMVLTCIELISDSNEWLERHPNFLNTICTWVMQFIADPRFSEHVADALEKIASRCAPHMKTLVLNLNALIPQLEASTKNGYGIEKAINGLLKAISAIISQLDPSEMRAAYEQLCEPILVNLNKAIEITNSRGVLTVQPDIEVNKENESNSQAWAKLAHEPILWIDRIASIFRDPWKPPQGYPEPVPWYHISVKIFELLFKAMRKFESINRMIEHCCRSMRFLIRSLGVQSVTFVQPLVTTMLDIYTRHHHSSFLYVSSILVDEYGSQPTLKPFLTEMLVSFVNNTLPIFNQPLGLVNNPDTVDDLFRLSQRFVLRSPSEFFLNPISRIITECGIQALQLEHHDANRSVTRFFIEILEQLKRAKKANIEDAGVTAAHVLLQQVGGKIVYSALFSAIFKVVGGLARDMAEIIAMLARLDKPILERWLREAVVALPNDPPKATPEQLQTFVTTCLGERETTAYAINTQIKELIQLFS